MAGLGEQEHPPQLAGLWETPPKVPLAKTPSTLFGAGLVIANTRYNMSARQVFLILRMTMAICDQQRALPLDRWPDLPCLHYDLYQTLCLVSCTGYISGIKIANPNLKDFHP